MPDAEPFESPLETLSDGVWLLEADGRLAAANRAFAALLDPAAETPARGTSWKDLAELLGRFGRCHSGGVEFPIDSLVREGRRRPIACDYRRRDGGGLALSAGPDPRGGLMLVLAEPPAERGELRATRLLRQSQANLAAAQRIAKLGSWEFDLVDLGNIDANPLRWSDETFRIFGYEPGGVAVSNESYLRAVHADDRQRVRETLEKSVAQGTGYDIEYRIVRPNGAEVVVHERSDILRDPRTGSVTKMVGTTQDITERKRIELALKQARDRAQQYLDVAAVIFAVLNPDHTVAMLKPEGPGDPGCQRAAGDRAKLVRRLCTAGRPRAAACGLCRLSHRAAGACRGHGEDHPHQPRRDSTDRLA